MRSTDWPAYLDRFHADRPGITEALLRRTSADGNDPYRWAAMALPPRGAVVDVACGSAPLAEHLDHDRYLGIDRSAAELALAADRVGHDRVVFADATDLPLPDGAADCGTVLMGLMLLQPLAAAQAELRRVVRPGGRLVALLPGRLPDRPADALRWTALFAALGKAEASWPNPVTLGAADRWLDPAFRVVADRRRSFVLPLTDRAAAELLVTSLYLPDVPPARIDRAMRVAHSWLGGQIGLPLRLLVAERR